MANDSLATVSNLTKIAYLSYSLYKNCVETLMQFTSFVFDENVNVVSSADTETILQDMENLTSIQKSVKTKKKKKDQSSNLSKTPLKN